MNPAKKKKLEAAGWKVGTTAEFLGLDAAEAMLIDMKLALAESVKATRQEKRITQEQLARLLGSSQSRVAKLEAADSSVSMDLLIRSLGVMGLSSVDVGKMILRKKRPAKQSSSQKKLPTKREKVS